MNQFEKEYYEASSFWEGNMVQDPENVERITRTVKLIPENISNLIDVGCGNGVFVNYLSKARPQLEITGTDRSATALSFVKVKKVESDISRLPFESNSFDCVTCLEVIEHLPVPVYKLALSELARISKKYLIISVPYAEKLEDSHTKCPSCTSIFNYQLHLRNYHESNMLDLLSEFGYTCIKVEKFGILQNYYGHRFYTRLFDPKQVLSWRSPICPICGYSSELEKQELQEASYNFSPVMQKKGLISRVLAPIKSIWPKEKQFYWIMGLYEKQ